MVKRQFRAVIIASLRFVLKDVRLKEYLKINTQIKSNEVILSLSLGLYYLKRS